MPDSAERLLDLLQQRKLLPQNMIDGLRRQIAELPEEISAHHVAKLLQRKGKITAFQARELLAEVGGVAEESSEHAASPTTDDAAESANASLESELGLAEDEDDARQRRRKQSRTISAAKPNEPSVSAKAAPSFDEPAALGGGIDDLLDDPLISADVGTTDPLLLAPKKRNRWGIFGGGAKRGKRQAAGWDSPLIIVGGGILLLLLLIGGALAFVLTRGSGDELFAAAEQDYLDGAYAQAISKYEKFSARHSSHPKASLARVRIGLAKLRLTNSEGNWTAALEKAQAVLPTIETEAAFQSARPELAALLPEIAQGFAEQASSEDDLQAASALVEKFRAAMELIDNPAYLPSSQRATLNARLEKSAEKIALVVRRIDERSRLIETVAEIESLVADGQPMEAFARRDALLKSYPRLRDDPGLVAAVAAISSALVDHVAPGADTIPATTQERRSPVIAEIVPARASGDRADALKDHVAAMVIDGALYALSADEGLLLWRRFVGADTTEVLPVDASAGADLLVIDSQHHDLLRLSADEGKLVWRLPVGKPFSLSRVGNEQLLLTIRDGQLWEVAAEAGASSRQAHFPQSLAAAAVRSESGRVYVFGDHSNMYVLDDDSLQCRGVFHLGHQRGTIRQRPAAMGGLLVVPHHVSLRRSLLHVLREIDAAPLLEVAQSPATIEGHFVAPLVQQQLRIAAVTQGGGLSLLAVDPAEEETPLAIVANKSVGDTGGSAHLAVSADFLLVAHNGLAAYRMSTARGALAPRWLNHKGDTFLGALQVIGEHVIHARRRPNQAGVVIAATPRDAANAQDAGRPVWETVIALGSPKSSMDLSNDEKRLVAFCATGDIFDLQRANTASGSLNTPTIASAARGEFSTVVKLSDDRSLLVGEEQKVATVGDESPWQGESAATLAGADFSASVKWRDGLLAPTSLGQVVYLPTSPAAKAILPFQPRLVIGEIVQWLRPMPLSDEQFIIVNQSGEVYLVGIGREGAPHLTALSQARLPNRPIAASVLVNQSALFVTRGEDRDIAQPIELPELKALEETALPGRLRWGPHQVGDVLLLATTPGGLQAFTVDAALLWSSELRGEIPIGAALSDGEQLIVATSSGSVIYLGRADGKKIRRANLAQPLVDGPLIWGDRVALRASDGTILLISND